MAGTKDTGGERTATPDTLSSGECTVPFEFTLFVGKVRVAATSPQHQSPIFQFLLLQSLVVWFILLYCIVVLLFVRFEVISDYSCAGTSCVYDT